MIDATEGSRNAESLIDGTEETNWGGVTTDNVDASHPSVAVDLAGGKHTVRRVQVSAMPTRRRPATAGAAGGRPRLGVALHRAAPVRPGGVHQRL